MENKQIKDSEIILHIVRNIKEFEGALKKATLNWGEDDEFPVGLQLEEYAYFVYELLISEHVDQDLIQRCFDIIEELLKDGDQEVKRYIYFMFIESITNVLLNNDKTPRCIEKYLGPASKRAYDRINAFWEEGKIIESLD